MNSPRITINIREAIISPTVNGGPGSGPTLSRLHIVGKVNGKHTAIEGPFSTSSEGGQVARRMGIKLISREDYYAKYGNKQ